MAVDVVDLFIPMMEAMISLADVVPGCEAVYETDANAAAEVLGRVLFLRPAMVEHLLAGEAAAEPGGRRIQGLKSPQQGANQRQRCGFHRNNPWTE